MLVQRLVGQELERATFLVLKGAGIAATVDEQEHLILDELVG